MTSTAEVLDEARIREQWPCESSSYELLGKIGHGAFAVVWKAKTSDDRKCAVKILNLDHVDTNLEEIRLEVQAMRLSSHPNVLPCHTAFVNQSQLWLVTPLMAKGSSIHCLQTARRILRESGKIAKMEDHIMYIMHETLLGLQYIHDNGQIHRDIKAGNILLDGNGDVKIADFGVSGWLVQAGSQQEKAKTFVGTVVNMAPELMEQVHGYDYKADIWSLGITALELAKGYAPYAKYPPMKVLILTIQEDPPSLESYDEEGENDDDDYVEEEYSRSFSNMVTLCLSKNPSRRPTCQELLKSKHFSSINDPEERMKRRQSLKEKVCDPVRDVGEKEELASERGSANLPGNAPVSFFQSAEDNDRPAGTTWVFSDGSQVLSSTAKKSSTVDDVMAELDAFGKRTGGEHYSRETAAAVGLTLKETDGDEAGDDLDKFMDEFELHTAGEDFKHPSSRQT